jgi:HAD superfamily hydrolase (TIGR01662 family)
MQSARRGMVVFDLDGTLTVPNLDFDAMRAEIGLPPGPILESLESLDADRRLIADAILERHERLAAEQSQLYPGARRCIEQLRRAGAPVAILTRNAGRWAEHVVAMHGIVVDAIRSRDDGVVKPSAEPVLALCAQFDCDPQKSWMVGDHLFDIQSGRAAGCTTILMIGNGPPPPYATEATYIVTTLDEVVDLVLCGPV